MFTMVSSISASEFMIHNISSRTWTGIGNALRSCHHLPDHATAVEPASLHNSENNRVIDSNQNLPNFLNIEMAGKKRNNAQCNIMQVRQWVVT